MRPDDWQGPSGITQTDRPVCGYAVAEYAPDGRVYLLLGSYGEAYPTRAPADKQAASCRGRGPTDSRWAVISINPVEEPR